MPQGNGNHDDPAETVPPPASATGPAANGGAGSTTANGATRGGSTSDTAGSSTTGTKLPFDVGALLGKVLASPYTQLAVKAALLGARTFVLPVAESYARPPERPQGEPEEHSFGGLFTSAELATLKLAGEKLVYEAGTLLMAGFPVTADGKPPPQQRDDKGRFPEPSIAYLASAAKAVMAAIDGVTARRAAAAAAAEKKAAAAKADKPRDEAPVPVSLLRTRTPNRG